MNLDLGFFGADIKTIVADEQRGEQFSAVGTTTVLKYLVGAVTTIKATMTHRELFESAAVLICVSLMNKVDRIHRAAAIRTRQADNTVSSPDDDQFSKIAIL